MSNRSATTVPAVTKRPTPKPEDNQVSLAYKLGQDHALAGVLSVVGEMMLLPHLRDIYLNGYASVIR